MYNYQYPEEPPPRRFPKSPLDRRMYAFGIDFLSIGLLGSFFSKNWFVHILLLIILWLGWRVIVVERNRGQSLGRWLLDIKVIDRRFNRTPGLQELLLREGVVGGASVLALLGISHGLPNFFSVLLLFLPLLLDCGLALLDEQTSQAFHDQISNTAMVQTRRGFSLDLKVKKLWLTWKRRKRP